MNPAEEFDNQKKNAKAPEWPWWEPYVFTSFVLVGVLVFLMICGVIARIPLMEHILLGLMTLAALFDFFRKKGELPSVAGKLGSTLFFGFIGGLYLNQAQWIPGIGYCGMSLVWFVLFVLSVRERRRIRLETLKKLDQVIDSLRDAETS